MPVSELSLLDALANSKSRYDVSIISTFNSYLPFYEDIVFHRLRNSGCRGNALLMDSNQILSALNDTFYRPRFAGKGYTLIPIEVENRCFHPKVVLLLGKEHCSLFIGSHNQTISGFGRNRELTASFEIDRESSDTERIIFRDAWQAIRNWTVNQPDELLATIALGENIAAWAFAETGKAAPAKHTFLATSHDSTPLWHQLKQYLPRKIKRATLIAPFFGENLSFLEALISDLNPDECIVGIDPSTVHIVPNASDLLPPVRFVETDSLYGGRGYLHAKSILLETDTEEEYLIIGSANASRSAWLEISPKRNLEAVVLIHSDGKSDAHDLGLRTLANNPTISKDRWELVKQNRDNPENYEVERLPLLIAVETEEGFEIVLPPALIGDLGTAELYEADGSFLAEVQWTESEDGRALIRIDEHNVRQKTSAIRLRKEDGETLRVFVHHTSEIVRGLSNSKYRDFFSELEGFNFGVNEEFWKLIDKIVFTDGDELPDNISVQFSQRIGNQELKAGESTEPARQKIFSVPTIASNRLGNLTTIPQDSLSELLSFINKRLYSPSEVQKGQITTRSEEEIIGSEDEEIAKIGDERERLEKLAELCRKRTKTMMSRMVTKLKKAPGGDAKRAFVLIRQLAVVLGVLKLIRDYEEQQDSVHRLSSFIDTNSEWDFFIEAVRLVSVGEVNIIESLQALRDCRFSNEVSNVIGMLVWLAYEVGLHINRLNSVQDRLYSDSYDDQWEVDYILVGSACLLKLAPWFYDDDVAKETAVKALKSKSAKQWLNEHLGWMNVVSTAYDDVSLLPSPKRNPQIGDYAYQKTAKNPELLIVAKNPGSTELIDLSSKDGKKTLGKGYAVTVSLQLPPSLPRLS